VIQKVKDWTLRYGAKNVLNLYYKRLGFLIIIIIILQSLRILLQTKNKINRLLETHTHVQQQQQQRATATYTATCPKT
jgi:hypothetical protein